MKRRNGRPDVSVIMPVAAGCSASGALSALKSGIPAGLRAELLLITGTQPSQQRNLASRRASAPVLYFLDHDSRVRGWTINRLLRAMRGERVAAAGGPSLGGSPGGLFNAAVDAVFRSPFGSPLVSSRYTQRGIARDAGEKDLILCNMMVRRGDFLALGGFDPRLYPNEENEFLNRLKDSGGRSIYVPEAGILKPRKYGLGGFIWENFRNGRGRMEQAWIDFHAGDGIFLAILLSTCVFAVAAALRPFLLVFAALYILSALIAGFLGAGGSRPGFLAKLAQFAKGALISFLIAVRHSSYAAGLLWGGFFGWRKRGVKITPRVFRLDRYLVGRGRATMCRSEKLGVGLAPGREE